MRFKIGRSDPYTYYGGAIGLWDRLEFHGQFTEINTIEAFEGYDYGHYKDRSAGARLVLIKEDNFWPQVAIGAFDATGTALFGQRYIVLSKMLGDFDLTFGLGQGVLAGEFVGGSADAVVGSAEDSGFAFLLSSPWRETRPFAGVEWHITPDLTLSAEYSSLDYKQMFGFRDKEGKEVKKDDSRTKINFGLKYKLTQNVHTHLAYMRGREFSWSVDLDFPLESEGFLGWKKETPYEAMEKLKWQAYEADNNELALLIAGQIKSDGFEEVGVACSDHSLWIEIKNTKYLSPARAFGRIASVAEAISPPRIDTFYLNLKNKGQIIQSLKCSRQDLRAFVESRLDKDGFLQFADLDLYKTKHWQEFAQAPGASSIQKKEDIWYDCEIMPRVRTFLNNKEGFFKHKIVVQSRLKLYPWTGGLLTGELEHTLYNQYKDIDYDPLEPDATRTDIKLYEERSAPRISMLAFDQIYELPYNILARGAIGIFEPAYAGVGVELFRYFNDGLWGIGFESEIVKKRDFEENFKLRDDLDTTYTTGFLNIYAQIWPDQGLEGGLKIGRFLAGDKGFRIDIRRSFKYFTLGGWYTRTDTSIFTSEKNIGATEKGVYIRIPFSIFSDHERRGHFTYGITSFTKDPGQLVRQPRRLYPLDPWSTPDHTKRHLEDMRQ
jgi:hypothetical protein